jgi:DNA-binding MarR family transcriptional regulator
MQCDDEDGTPITTYLDQHVGYLLRRSYAVSRKNTAEALTELGDISPVQASVLATLQLRPMTQADLGRHIGMEPANIHALVKRMIAAGLVSIRPHADNRRLTLVEHTPSGRAIAARLKPVLARSAAATMADLDDAERHMLVALLRRVVAASPD